jgi:hypothetical protein
MKYWLYSFYSILPIIGWDKIVKYNSGCDYYNISTFNLFLYYLNYFVLYHHYIYFYHNIIIFINLAEVFYILVIMGLEETLNSLMDVV